MLNVRAERVVPPHEPRMKPYTMVVASEGSVTEDSSVLFEVLHTADQRQH